MNEIQTEPHNIISWNKRFLRYEEGKDDDYVDIYFHDQEVIRASVLVAADGIFSSVRQQLFQSQSHGLNYLGLMVILGISPCAQSDDVTSFISTGRLFRKQVQWVDGRTRVFVMPYDDKHTMWQLSYPIEENVALQIQSNGGEALKAEALRKCHGWDPSLVQLIQNTPISDLSGHPAYDRDPITLTELQRYRNKQSKVTFVGDSLHPMSPFKGQGANQALVDALSLARAITSSDYVSSGRRPLYEALRIYEGEMLQR